MVANLCFPYILLIVRNMTALENLHTEEFVESIGFYSTAQGLYLALAKSQFVGELSIAIRTGEVSIDELRSFVEQISAKFERGKRFSEEVSLAAICVAIEDLPNSFSEEFLIDLARVNVTEIPYASKVAAICVAHLFRLPKTVDEAVRCQGGQTTACDQDSITIDYVESSELYDNPWLLEECEECAN